MNNVEDIRQDFRDKLATEDFVIDKTGVKMIEIINANFNADEDIIFGTHSPDWYDRELQWFLSQSLNVNDIPPPIPKIWQQVATEEGFVNSNYGWCVYSDENFWQYTSCLQTLEKHQDSRRAIMIYNRPSMQLDYSHGGRSDFMCMQNTQHFIRDNKLSTHVNMRSNDAIHGFKGDYFWVNYVHSMLHNDLLKTYPDLELGEIIWNAMSLHCYQYHWHLIK